MNKKVLIIDDDKDILEMLDIVLQSPDIDIVLSNNGMTGDEIKAIHPDIILLDIQIKGYIHTGDEICKEIKSTYNLNKVPVILISSEPDLNLIAVECEADGYISKPFDIIELKSIIGNMLL